jgi:hypothetical protein
MYNAAGYNQPNHTVGTTWTRIYDTASSFSSSPYEQPSIGLDTGFGSSYNGTVCLDLYGATLTPGSAIMAYVSTSASGAPAPIQPRTVVNGLPVATLPINAATQIAGILPTAQGGLGANNSSVSGIPRFASGVATVTAEVGISGGSPVKATNTYGCLDGYDHLGCVVWRATRLTAQTASAGTADFVPGLAGWYRMSVMGCITTVGTAGTLSTTIWTGPIQGPVISFTSGLGNCTVVRQDEYAPASGTTYQMGDSGNVTGNVGGQYSLDAVAEYMGP